MNEWQLAAQPHVFPGYALGSRYPSLRLALRGREIQQYVRDDLWRSLVEACPALSVQLQPAASGGPVLPDTDWREGLLWLLSVWQRLQEAQGLAVYETGRILVPGAALAHCLLPVSNGAHRAMALVVEATLKWLEQSGHAATGEKQKAARIELIQAVRGVAAFAPSGANVPRFIKAAYGLGMPVANLPGGVVQYALGSRARRLDSSFTDVTPWIAAKLARNKAWASALMAQAGLPVPPHLGAVDADAAVKAAHQLGYPVVVKPADLDGGKGVAAGLATEQEVRQAFEVAKVLSKNVLVEKHVHGKDYRLTVFQGEVIWAIERIPAGVQGDGFSTVGQLVDQVNANPLRGVGTYAPLRRLQLDELALELLDRQGLSEAAVPAPSQFVFLRRVANVASGGQPVAVFDKVHPDNARLAVRAAELLGLDLAGIDLLIPDVARSWQEGSNKAAICEVNGQPYLGQTTALHVYDQILRRLVAGDGRIPTLLVLGAEEPAVWLAALAAELSNLGLRVGVAGPQGVSLAGERLTAGAVGFFDAGRMLALNRQVDAMVMAVTEDSLLRTGLPWARYDALVLAGTRMPMGRVGDQVPVPGSLRQWLSSLLPACDGAVVANSSTGVKVSGVETLTLALWHDVGGTTVAMAKQTVHWVLAEHQRRQTRDDGGV
jgi:cyanophycin synthetase